MAAPYAKQGKQLREWRERAKLTVADVVEYLAERGVKLKEYSILNIEAGKVRMWASTFKDYMIALGIPDQQAPDYFSFAQDGSTKPKGAPTRRSGAEAEAHSAAKAKEKEAVSAANLLFAEETKGPSAKYRAAVEAHLSEYILATEAARKKREATKACAKAEYEEVRKATDQKSPDKAPAKNWESMSDAEMLAELMGDA